MFLWLVACSQWFQRNWRWLAYPTIFLIAVAVLTPLQWNSLFADPDSFYHAKMAILLRDQGIVTVFPWLKLTVLGQAYTDQHLLYHVLLIPFVTWWPPLVGLKIATVLFGATLITVAYWFMRQFNVRWPFVFAMILLLTRPFSFRISLAKAPSTSIIILLIGLAWIFRYRFRRLFVLSFIYVWYYGGFPLLGVAASVYGVISVAYNRLVSKFSLRRWLEKVRSILGHHHRNHDRQWLNLRVVLTVFAGLLVGLIVNPYFPRNVMFYAQQLVNIGVINFQHVIGVGGEWYPYGFANLVADAAFPSVLLLGAVLAIVANWRAQSKQSWTMAVLTGFFFVLTLKSRRYIEYYVPFAVIFSALSISDTLRATSGADIRELLPRFLRRAARPMGVMALGVLLFVFGYIAGRDYWQERSDLRHGFAFTEFQGAAQWLAANTPAGSRVMHSDWDEFPMLFYHDSHNTYIVGLDPTFLYKASPDLYWTWANITLGKYDGNATTAVRETLGAQYIFIATGHAQMDAYFSNSPQWKLAYSDGEAKIYAPTE